jgi:hypothetical protein
MDNNYNGGGYGAEPLEPQVSDDGFNQDPVLAEYQTSQYQSHWVAELEASRKERKKFVEDGDKIVKRYCDEQLNETTARNRYNLFFANTENKIAALYSRTPEPTVSRRFSDPTDDVSRVAANLLKRSICYELDCANFDHTFKQILFDRLVPGVGIGWARLEVTEGEPQYQQVGIDPETGEPIVQPIEGSEIVDQFACIDYVAWNDFVWSPSRTWADCRWVGRRIPMSKDAIKERFHDTAPQEALSSLPFSTHQSDPANINTSSAPKNETVATVDVYEIWDKERKLVWWIAETSPVPLDVQSDRMEFEQFFPTPLPPLARFTTSTTTPVSDFHLVKNLYNELDVLNERASNKLRAIRTMWGFDASQAELQNLFDTPEFKGVPMRDWAVLQGEKGGINGSVQFFDNSPMVNEYMLLITARDRVKAQIFEIEGVPDTLRGATQQYESATATDAKATIGSARFATMQKDTAEYVAWLLRLKAHLICKFYKPEFIVKRAGVIAPVDQQYIGPALQLLADAQMQQFRLLVSTDSLQLPSMSQHKREKSEAAQAIVALLGQVMPAAQQNPAVGVFGGELAKWLIVDFPGSDGLEGYLDQFLEKSAQMAAQQAAQPPKPTDAELKAQAQMAAAQADLQKAQLREQTNVMVAQVQAEAKKAIAALQAEVDQLKLAVQQKEHQDDIAIKAAKVQIEGTRAAHENARDVAALVRQ